MVDRTWDGNWGPALSGPSLSRAARVESTAGWIDGVTRRSVSATLSRDGPGEAQVVKGLAVEGNVEQALEDVGVPSYVLDTTGVVRWLNPAAERLLGDVRGRHFTSVVAPEDRRRAQELFSRKVLGTTSATDTTGVLVSTDGTRLAL